MPESLRLQDIICISRYYDDVHASDRKLTETGSAKFFVRDSRDTVIQNRGILIEKLVEYGLLSSKIIRKCT